MKTILQIFLALFISSLSFLTPSLKAESPIKPISHVLPTEIRYEYVIIDGVKWVYVYENDILIATYEDEED